MREFLATISFLFVLGSLTVAQSTSGSSPGGATAATEQKKDKVTIRPGYDCHDNGDVEVCNTTPQGGGNRPIEVEPAEGNGHTATSIEFASGAHGTVVGLDANDTLTLEGNSHANVIGTGGLVNVTGNGASGTVTNNGPGGPGSTNIQIRLDHMTVYLPPGSSISFGPSSPAPE